MHFLNRKNALFLLSVPNMCNLNITFYLLHSKSIEKEVIKREKGEKKKMVKASGKIWMAIAAILLISLIGTASAVSSIGKNPNALELQQGESGTFTITVEAESSTNNGFFGVDIYPRKSEFDVVIRDSTGTLASGDGDNTVSTSEVSYTEGQTTTLYVDITNNNAPLGNYTVKFTANDGKEDWTEGTLRARLQSSEIPEFATIAVPVAALLLLIFVFNQRKRRQ